LVKTTLGFLVMVAAGVTLYGHIRHPVPNAPAADRSVALVDATPSPGEIVIVPFNGGLVAERWANPPQGNSR
jgi:hypothetical protein